MQACLAADTDGWVSILLEEVGGTQTLGASLQVTGGIRSLAGSGPELASGAQLAQLDVQVNKAETLGGRSYFYWELPFTPGEKEFRLGWAVTPDAATSRGVFAESFGEKLIFSKALRQPCTVKAKVSLKLDLLTLVQPRGGFNPSFVSDFEFQVAKAVGIDVSRVRLETMETGVLVSFSIYTDATGVQSAVEVNSLFAALIKDSSSILYKDPAYTVLRLADSTYYTTEEDEGAIKAPTSDGSGAQIATAPISPISPVDQKPTDPIGGGISGAVTAVIVVVCLLVVAIVGFLVVWFVVQKKSTPELTEAFNDTAQQMCGCFSKTEEAPKFEIDHNPAAHNSLLGAPSNPTAVSTARLSVGDNVIGPAAALAPSPNNALTDPALLMASSPNRPPIRPLGYAIAKFDFGGGDETDLVFKVSLSILILKHLLSNNTISLFFC
jgi:hypothetical protein